LNNIVTMIGISI